MMMASPNGITVNGKPLQIFIDEEHRREISEVHRDELAQRKFARKRHSITKFDGNHSKAASRRGRIIFTHGQKETHVVIAGIILPWETKAPYVASGLSILGACEYNAESDELKCHVCGEWVHSLGQHVRRSHRIKAAAYKAKHGLGLNRGLIGLRERALRRSVPIPKSTFIPKSLSVRPDRRAAELRAASGKGFSLTPELDNLKSRCKAQLEDRLVALAKELGRKPTFRELRKAHLHPDTLRTVFGIETSEILSRVMKQRRYLTA
jgi:hypothetical protein